VSALIERCTSAVLATAIADASALFDDLARVDTGSAYEALLHAHFADVSPYELAREYLALLRNNQEGLASDVDLRHASRLLSAAFARGTNSDSECLTLLSRVADDDLAGAVALVPVISDQHVWSSILFVEPALAELPKCVYDAFKMLKLSRSEYLRREIASNHRGLDARQYALARALCAEWEGTLTELLATTTRLSP
jgi:hypothetical protein